MDIKIFVSFQYMKRWFETFFFFFKKNAGFVLERINTAGVTGKVNPCTVALDCTGQANTRRVRKKVPHSFTHTVALRRMFFNG